MRLKWIFGGGLVIIALGAIGQIVFSEKEVTSEVRGPSRGQINRAARTLVSPAAAEKGYKVNILIAGTHPSENTWGVRGSFVSAGDARDIVTGGVPFFGSITSICDDWPEKRCWRLAELVINGVEQPIVEIDETTAPNRNGDIGNRSGPTIKPPTVKPKKALKKAKAPIAVEAPKLAASSPLTGRSTGETKAPDRQSKGRSVRLRLDPIETKKKIKRKPEFQRREVGKSEPRNSAAQKVQGSKWRTVVDNVNARSGPGTKFEVHFKMPRTTDLKLLKTQQGWGQFEYSGTNGTKGQVWISMNLVKRSGGAGE